MQRYVYPKIGEKRIDRVTTADLLGIIGPLWSAKPAMAEELQPWLVQVVKHGIAKG